MDQAEFQKKQGEIYPSLAGAVLNSIPEDWDAADLILGPATVKDGTESMTHELRNPKISTGLTTAMPNDDVYAQTRRLSLLFREYGSAWAKAVFRVSWDNTAEGWKFVMEYEYDN